MNAAAQIVDAHDLAYAYPGQSLDEAALRGASLSIGRGEIVLLRGPSGSGKTTLLTAIAGMLTTQRGTVTIDGVDVSALSRSARARFRLSHLGFVFQRFNVIGALTVTENVALPLTALGASTREASERVHDLLARLDLEQKHDCRARRLSGGEQQRVAIARALSTRPSIIFADEPTSSLDARNGERTMRLLCERARADGTAVAIASHDERVAPFVDRIISVTDGTCNA